MLTWISKPSQIFSLLKGTVAGGGKNEVGVKSLIKRKTELKKEEEDAIEGFD